MPVGIQDKHKHKSAAVVLPVRTVDEGVALESSFKDGVKNEVLRSLCQVVNTSELALEVTALFCIATASMLSSSRCCIRCMPWLETCLSHGCKQCEISIAAMPECKWLTLSRPSSLILQPALKLLQHAQAK